ncbi:hypothetical protein A4G99_18965 [Haladaptatus sp. R4]|nr:hypothetical protein A4G99_18965 [Haladaptatus sp. R4]
MAISIEQLVLPIEVCVIISYTFKALFMRVIHAVYLIKRFCGSSDPINTPDAAFRDMACKRPSVSTGVVHEHIHNRIDPMFVLNSENEFSHQGKLAYTE